MNALDVLSYSFSAIKLRKLRAGLTTLGVVIGIAAIVALLSITQGLQANITRQLQTGFATDTLIVSTGGGGGALGLGGSTGESNSGFQLYANYTQALNTLPNVETSMAIIEKRGFVDFNGTSQNVTIVGVDFAEYANIYSSTFVAGSGAIPLNPENDTVVIGNW